MNRTQLNNPRYAAERALKALAAGRLDQVRHEVELIRAERPADLGHFFGGQVTDAWAGPVLRNRVQVFEQLAVHLLNARLLPEAETVLWKALFEYHEAARPVEDLILWELLYYVKALQGQTPAAFEISRILAAHGAGEIRTPNRIGSADYTADPALFEPVADDLPPDIILNLSLIYTNPQETALLHGIEALTKTSKICPPATRRLIAEEVFGQLAQRGKPVLARADANEVLSELVPPEGFWNAADGTLRHAPSPDLLDLVWQDRPTTYGLTAADFLRQSAKSSGSQFFDFKTLERLDLGYFNRTSNVIHGEDGSAMLDRTNAGRMAVDFTSAAGRLYFAYEATPLLGLFPILLIRVDDGPYHPAYCASVGANVAALDVPIAAGRHQIDLIFLNGADFKMKDVDEQRTLKFLAMAAMPSK